MAGDRVGLAWRRELAADIGRCLDQGDGIDCLEVIAEQFFHATSAQRAGLASLARRVPLSLHGVSLGPATTLPLDTRVADQLARLCEEVRPAAWSEHLSFVRGGGHEIGHLAAPPRSEASVAATLKNLAAAARIVGAHPAVENIATLVTPPCSTLDEMQWLAQIVGAAPGGMLLDLHNLHANACNFGGDALAMLRRLPLDRVRQVHIAGGMLRSIGSGEQRLIDDHMHAVPATCYAMLEEVAACTAQPLTVILERDGRFPEFAELLAELAQARAALRRGRLRREAALVVH